MPLLIINMGGEMLYILDQRLSAQAIATDKSVRVLQDVVSTMFSEKFVKELFKPQKLYTNDNTRQIFDRLAHSSIMRLNQSSMSKLYDLMFMAVKYQLLSVKSADELAQITLNHLDAVRNLVKGTDASDEKMLAVLGLVDNAINCTVNMLQSMSLGDFALLRHTLCRFFQDRRIKVSLFLHDGIQQSDGAILINHKGSLPPGFANPGSVTYLDSSGNTVGDTTLKQHNTPNSSVACKAFDISHRNVNRYSELGTNLFAKDRRKQQPEKHTPVKNRHAPEADKDFVVDETAQKVAKNELNTLASLLGAAPASGNEKNIFTLQSLFPSAGDDDEKSGGIGVITFDVDDAKTNAQKIASSLGGLNLGGGEEEEEEEDDLLALMDSATSFDKNQVFSGGALGPSYNVRR